MGDENKGQRAPATGSDGRTAAIRFQGLEKKKEMFHFDFVVHFLNKKALDILGSTPWRINQFVLKIAQRLWEGGGGMLEMPSRTDLVIPTPPEGFLDDPKEV